MDEDMSAPEAMMIGTCHQLTDPAYRAVPKKEPIGFRIRKGKDHAPDAQDEHRPEDMGPRDRS